MCRAEETKEIGLTNEVMIVADGVYKGMISIVTEVIETKGKVALYRLHKDDLIEQMEERREELHHAICEARQDEDAKLIEMTIGEWDFVDEEIYRLKQKDSNVLFVESDLEKLDFDDEEEENVMSELERIKVGDTVEITAVDSVLYGEELEVVGFDTLEDTPVILLDLDKAVKLLRRKRNKLKLTSDTILENLIIEDIDKRIKAILEKGVFFITPNKVQKLEEVTTINFSDSDKPKEALKSTQESTSNELTKRFSDEIEEAKNKFEETVEQKTLRLIEIGDIVSHVDVKGLYKVIEKCGLYVVLMSQDNDGGFNGFESVVADSKVNGLRLEFRENRVREPYNDDIGRTVRFETKSFPEIECIVELSNGGIYKGKSRCNLMEDEFDAERGKKIAFLRANKKMSKDFLRRCNAELDKATQ